MLSVEGFAQSNFYKMSLGGGVGVTKSFTEVDASDYGLTVYGTGEYYFTPFISLSGEVQQGKIKSGDADEDSRGREFINSYRSINLTAKLQLGALVEYEQDPVLDIFKGLYLGAGLGAIQNRVTVNDRVFDENGEASNPGRNFTKDLYVPLNAGINFYFADGSGAYRYVFNMNYQTHITFGEGLDGYDDSNFTHRAGNTDIFSLFSVGLKYHFGPVGLSKKNFQKY